MLQVREQERRTEEQRAAKQAADAAWRRAQRERELAKKAEEEAREREVKVGLAAGWVPLTSFLVFESLLAL
jgi:hypothetical protein